MKNKSFEVSLSFRDENGVRNPLVRGALVSSGISEQEIIEQSHDGQICLSIYKKNASAALKLKNTLRSLKIKDVRVQYQAIATKDWQNLWKKEYKPFPLTEHFHIIPIEYRKTFQVKKRQSVYIDTSFAFGTGLHSTTRFMAEFIDRYQGKFHSFLDIGTGTGILSIIAAKCGAEDMLSIDLTREIIQITRANFKENQVPTHGLRAVNFASMTLSRQFDFVAANLITQDLITFKKKILSSVKPGGYLALSGISLKNYSLLRHAYKDFPLKCLRIRKGEGWVGLLFKRQRT